MESLLAGRLLGLLGHHDPTVAGLDEASDRLERALASSRFTIDEDAYLDHVAFAVRAASPADAPATPQSILETLSELDLEDLAFALACASGQPAAIATLEREMIEAVPKALVRLRPDARLVDDVRQELREKLLVAAHGKPKILDYKGRGPLAAWVRVVAMRIAYTHLRERTADGRSDDVAAFETLADGGDAPDVAHFKVTYAAEVRGAFQEAVAALPAEVRAVLRAHAIDGLTIDQIGALYQVHRATAARWLQQARATLLDALRASLKRRLGVEADACDSIVALVQSRIDLSMTRVFATAADSG